LGGNDLMSYSTTISSCANPGVWINKLGELGGSFFIELFKPRKVWWGKQNVFDAVVVIGNYEEVLPQLQVDKINALKKLKWGVLIFSLALSITHLIVEETWGKTISNNISTL
jgi:hypothetical protein